MRVRAMVGVVSRRAIEMTVELPAQGSLPFESIRHAADDALGDARLAESAAATELERLWQSIESGFSAWDRAYDDAVGGIEDAMEASGVDDSWWEDLLDGIGQPPAKAAASH